MKARILLFAVGLLASASFIHTAPAMAKDWTYTARPGDTLWSISDIYLRSPTDWLVLQQHNQITDPKKIAPGTQIRIPLALLKQKPDPVIVSFVRGTAWLRRGKASDPALPLSAGSLLNVGDRISTDADASVTLTFADGSIVTVSERSELELDTISTHRASGMVDTRLRLQRGQVQSQVRPREKPGARFEVITPAAVAAARGTGFRVTSIESPAAMRSEVTEGNIGVSAQSVERAVAAGYGVITTKGEAPGYPTQIPAAPNLARIPGALAPGDRASWDPVLGAVGYRVIILDAQASAARISEKSQTEAILVWPDIKPGQYRLQIRATDATGFEGLDGEQAITGLAPPAAADLAAPETVSPRDFTNTHSQQLTFHWRAIAGANTYRIQIQAADAATPVLDAVIDSLHYMTPIPLPAGHYVWRVAAHNAAKKQSAFSGEVHFAVLTTSTP